MTLPADEPALEPTPERVPGGRRAAIVVLVAAILVVGTLLWKPWDSGAPAAATAPTFPALALASATPAATPILAPTIASSTQEPMNAPDNLGNVALTTDSGPFVQCVYGLPVKDQRPLRSMRVAAPIVRPYFGITDAHVNQVEFRAELEANALQSIFSKEWQFVHATRKQRREVTENGAVPFDATTVTVPASDTPGSAIYRVAVVVDWVSRGSSPVATLRLYPHTYAPYDDLSAAPEPDGCPAWMPRA